MSNENLTGPELFQRGQEWLKKAEENYDRLGGLDGYAGASAAIAQAHFTGANAAVMATMLVDGLTSETDETDEERLQTLGRDWRGVAGIEFPVRASA